MLLDTYEINNETLLIMPVSGNKSKIIEVDGEVIVNKSCLSIIKDSCLYFGSSYEGRRDGVKYATGVEMKVPILIEESRNILFFPISSCVHDDSIWISFKNLVRYFKVDAKSTKLMFNKNKTFVVDVKYNLVDNQYIRCIKLCSILERRKRFLDNNNYIVDKY